MWSSMPLSIRSLFCAAVFIAGFAGCARGDSDLVTVTSPNGQIEFDLFLTQQPDLSEPLVRLAYQVIFKGKMLMDTSFMGLNIRDQPILGTNVGLTRPRNYGRRRLYSPGGQDQAHPRPLQPVDRRIPAERVRWDGASTWKCAFTTTE